MFIAYFDESGHSAGTEFVSVGGFVADAEQWRLFDQRWNDALAAHNAPSSVDTQNRPLIDTAKPAIN